MLALVRDAVLDAALSTAVRQKSTPIPAVLSVAQISTLRQDSESLVLRLNSITRQRALLTAAETASNLDPASQSAPDPLLFALSEDLIRAQQKLIDTRDIQLGHYLALLQSVADSYVFPVSSVLSATFVEHGAKSRAEDTPNFDADSLLMSDALSDVLGSEASDSPDLSPWIMSGMLQLQKPDVSTSVESLRTQLLQRDAQIQNLSSTSQPETDRLQSQVQELEDKIKQILKSDAQLQIAHLKQELSEAQQEIIAAQNELKIKEEEHMRDLASAGTLLAAADSSKREEVSKQQYEQEKASLIQQLDTFRNERDALTSQHATEVATILTQNAQLNDQINSMKNSHEAFVITHQQQLATIRSELKQSQASFYSLQQQLEQTNVQRDPQTGPISKSIGGAFTGAGVGGTVLDGTTLNPAERSLAQENTSLKRQLDDLQAKLDENTEEFQTVLMRNASLNEKLATADARSTNRNSVSSLTAVTAISTPIGMSPTKNSPSKSPSRSPIRGLFGVNNNNSSSPVPIASDDGGRDQRRLQAAYDNLLSYSRETDRERASLEKDVDNMHSQISALETRLSDLQVQNLSRSQVGSPTMGDTTSVAVLRREFRTIVSEMRSNHVREMKAQQEERRRLERTIRDLRRAEGGVFSS
ncbi:uncharacterized protein V1516DRAFT_677740 [Lipomyces oligophaga]|uniref:uncharacterized protein n=1 Tax=Lipomyces oligophaga TaxID=45792 RepID=UPI0034CDC4A9